MDRVARAVQPGFMSEYVAGAKLETTRQLLAELHTAHALHLSHVKGFLCEMAETMLGVGWEGDRETVSIQETTQLLLAAARRDREALGGCVPTSTNA